MAPVEYSGRSLKLTSRFFSASVRSWPFFHFTRAGFMAFIWALVSVMASLPLTSLKLPTRPSAYTGADWRTKVASQSIELSSSKSGQVFSTGTSTFSAT